MTALAEQALEALGELLRGFQAADEASGGRLLGAVLRDDPARVHGGLLAALMRLVFLLYAEDLGLLPTSPASAAEGSVTGLFARLREGHGRLPEGMDQRHGAWALLLALFRALHGGASPGALRLFDPDAYPFLEGRPHRSIRAEGERIPPPEVTDATVYRVLDKLLSIDGDVDGERLSYRALDVEQIGRIYEGVMGYAIERLPAGTLALRPTEERRRSGAHYTPRSLTEPVVRATLEPVLASLGAEGPRPEQILALKVADPAMGSGAFLVEACRYLADALVRAFRDHGGAKERLPDEDPVLHARRLVAQRCLYGVDKDPFAVDLARLSLWLFTRASDPPVTFMAHALRHGDALVGLSADQILGFTWDPGGQGRTWESPRRSRASAEALAEPRLLGDLLVAAFFEGENEKARERSRVKYARRARRALLGKGSRQELEEVVAGLREGERGVPAFHWEIEFPEVFSGDNPGFDALVGNPPFLGGTKISTAHSTAYLDWLNALFPESGGRMDLVAYFFRRAFTLLRRGGTFGLIATNTIAQGDTRKGGLRWICSNGGTIYEARRRCAWPGEAAVLVSVVHVARGLRGPPPRLDGQLVEKITAYLFHAGGHDDPAALRANRGKAFEGVKTYGQGFLFDDASPRCTETAEMERLIAASPESKSRIFPYLGGEEVNSDPRHAPRRHVIHFGEMSEQEARRWPALLAIVESKVKPERARKSADVAGFPWWQLWRARRELTAAIEGFSRVLVMARVSQFVALAFVPQGTIFSEQLVVFALREDASFAMLQSRAHEVWARFFASSLEDRLRYTPSDCFETFPFPLPQEPTQDPRIEACRAALELAGKTYHARRAALMIKNDQGLTATYNRFHDPEDHDPEIQELRDLHDELDRRVLSAYGWGDIPAACEFLLDHDERRKKKPWRYRWPDAVRDLVLARLIDLNQRRAAEEAPG